MFLRINTLNSDYLEKTKLKNEFKKPYSDFDELVISMFEKQCFQFFGTYKK